MGLRTRHLLALSVVTSALILSASLATPASAATKKLTSATALRSLAKQTNALPRTATSNAKRNKLRLAAAHARKVGRRQPCAAISDLAKYRAVLRGIKVKSGKRFRKLARQIGALQPASMIASRLLLANKRTKKCGGGVAPSTVKTAETKLIRSDETGMQLHVDMPDLNFVARTAGGKSWTELKAPNTDAPAAPGQPSIPVASSSFAIPDGATLEVKPTSSQSYTVDGVDVFPAQPDVVDDAPAPNFQAGPYKDAAFTMDPKAYKAPGFQPSDAASGQILGSARDLVIGGVQIPSAQYNAPAKTLKVFKSVDVIINFNGGDHTFSSDLSSPWESFARQLSSLLLNSAAIRFRPGIFRKCGEEMLVLTNPATLAAADQFAAGKRAQGMRTSVFQVGAAGVGSTPVEIQSFIRNRLLSLLCIHPSYVTIIGDDDLVPTFTSGPGGIPSDLPYSMKNDLDELPDLAVGRIIGNDQTEVGNAITKILTYENTPPTGAFLHKATVAAQFQDDNADGREERTFVQFAETVRNGLVGRGVTVDRIYHDSPTTTPQKFNDGTPLPADLLKPGFAWNGTGAQVSAAWNDGRFLMVHRDHGWSDGWGTPGFGTADVNALTNGSLLPVLLSINCSSGAYDYDETSFAGQALVKADGGAVGVFGDTRDSPTWHNSQIALGFVDALLPSVLPAEGPATKQRTGAALINGKLRLAGLAPPATDGSTRQELYLWHYFGDPSMQMWGGDPPLVIDVSQIRAIYKEAVDGPPPPNPPPYFVHVTLPPGLNGQVISLLRNGDVVGKAVIGGDAADVPADFDNSKPNPGELQVAIDPNGGQPASAPVEGVPEKQPPPPPPPADTSMSQTCPTEGPNDSRASNTSIVTKGTLSPALTGATIVLKYTRPDATTFERTTTTDSDGGWSDTFVPDSSLNGNPSNRTGAWKVQGRFDGDSTHKASTAGECTFYTFDNS
jgi:hypothetical protein